MLKSRNRLSVTLILALVAMACAWTMASAGGFRSVSAPVTASSEISKQAPTVTAGEPDQPLGPIVPISPQGGVPPPQPVEEDEGDGFVEVIRMIGRLLAPWYMGVWY